MPFSRGFRSLMQQRLKRDPAFKRAILEEIKDATNQGEPLEAQMMLDEVIDESVAPKN